MGSIGASRCMKAYSASSVVRTIAGLRDSSAPFIFQGSASVKYLMENAIIVQGIGGRIIDSKR